MGIRESLQRLLDRKQAEVRELEGRLREANAYIQAMQDSIRLVPRDADSSNPAPASEPALRPGSELAKIQRIIQAAGAPMHINEILKALGKPIDPKRRVSLVGTLGSYSRKGKVFTRTAPNTFGLDGLENRNETEELPTEFGSMTAAPIEDDDIPF